MVGRVIFGVASLVATLATTAVLTAKPSAAQLISHCEQRFGVALVTDDARLRAAYSLDWIPANEDHVRAYVPILEEELARYPKSTLPRAGVKEIVLARRVEESDHRWGGMACYQSNAIILSADGTLALTDAHETEEWARRSVHHELFHMLDYALAARALSNDAWSTLNEPDFAGYLGRGASAPRRHPGFVSPYAESTPEDDRAELYAYLVVTPAHVAALAARDSVLRAKVERLQHVLRDSMPELAGLLP